MNGDRVKEYGLKTAIVIGVMLWCYSATQYTDIGVAHHFIPAVIDTTLSTVFEQHFWQFVLGFTAIGLLSRGHLWSYGINSNNLKSSMRWLAVLYTGTIIGTAIDRISGTSIMPVETSMLSLDEPNMILALVIYWMSSPIAHQILFFGFAQTVLAKKVFSGNGTASMVVVVFVTSGLLAWTGTIGYDSVSMVERIHLFVLGIFSGIVYWKTGSLITPMLGHAFIFGFPAVIEIVARYISV